MSNAISDKSSLSCVKNWIVRFELGHLKSEDEECLADRLKLQI